MRVKADSVICYPALSAAVDPRVVALFVTADQELWLFLVRQSKGCGPFCYGRLRFKALLVTDYGCSEGRPERRSIVSHGWFDRFLPSSEGCAQTLLHIM